ncbi:SKP1-like protein 21 isoform X3 [Cynara cardunculus var. scolymus]|uniref:SKP1-like protein 21 isoform X3 n=1 Tax=Cynara cardunculus var. scolymus TaxID=59895 RepID=UPI000D62E600|nr:SKP1-like protein 21 isoform X3 [Cynara cardunculus var. scolymus]
MVYIEINYFTFFRHKVRWFLGFLFLLASRLSRGARCDETLFVKKTCTIANVECNTRRCISLWLIIVEGSMAVMKPEMKSFIWLETPDGSTQQVEEEVAMFCPMICREVLQTGMGSSKNYAIKLPQRVNPSVLGLILDYCRFHQVPGRSNKERKTFDEKFIRLDTKKLCELTSGADSLQLRPLVDLTSRALARMIEGKTPEEIRDTFHLPDDLTEEEKLEPLRNRTDDPRIRLLNRLYARKRKELKVRETSKNVEIEEERVDDRSVDDLLLFINSGDEDSKGVKSVKNKKKNRRRKDHSKDSSLNIQNGCHKKIVYLLPITARLRMCQVQVKFRSC